MRTDTILQDLVKFVEGKMPGIDVSGATDLQSDVPFDSLDRMELLLMVQRQYNVVIDPDQYLDDELQVLQSLAAFIATQTPTC